MLWLADLFYAVAALFYLPFALYNAIVKGKNRTGWGQRFGRLPVFEPSTRRIWVHAVSLGEINATPRLAKLLLDQVPDAQIIFSTTTDTGYRRAVELYGKDRVFRFPLDFSWVIRRVFSAVRPAMIVLVELEVWPNVVAEAARRGVPVVVVNGRLTERSARRLAWLRSAMRRVFSKLTWIGAQDDAIAARFRALGVDPQRVEVTGSVKWDTAIVTDRVAGDAALSQALSLDRSRPIWVCGSTGPGEESILLDAYAKILQTTGGDRKSPRLILIPRKPERFGEVAGLIASRGYGCVRRTAHPNGSKPPELTGNSVILGDTMGELRVFYSLADVVFVGRSLVPMGGSDPMEAAGLGKPIVIGPHTDNFQQPVHALREGGALAVADNLAGLIEQMQEWLVDPDELERRGRRGREIVIANQGATEKTVTRLVEILCGVPHTATAFQRSHSSVNSAAPEHQ
jgi:3-deoxy-D-manno-octulosonic-acid transferase